MTAVAAFNLAHDSDGKVAYAPQPTYTSGSPLAANTAVSFTVPTGAGFVAFASDVNIWVNYTTTATIPGSKIDNGTSSEMNPSVRAIPSTATTISVIASAAGNVTLAFYLRD